ncbi:hypothetical protein RvY_06297 [Ramazzottius varieornatus]|uniref:Uncharacterized protein n=1 Tax=Ramazzottius varieornatus TaxID=947166 RepID=A0A1D1V3K1_RAMVA|nr:hypothetical protein RvY_06297 [Ramazzottius varieornatus]
MDTIWKIRGEKLKRWRRADFRFETGDEVQSSFRAVQSIWITGTLNGDEEFLDTLWKGPVGLQL